MNGHSRPIVRLAEAPGNICLLRLSALGDVTHAVPVVRALQAHWRAARITWIIGAIEHQLLSGMDGVEFLVIDKRDGLAGVRKLRRQLHGRAFDVLLHMQVAFRANLLSLLVKAPVRLGWDRHRSRDRHYWFVNRQVAAVPFQHQVQGFLEFPRALGIEVDQPSWNLPVAPEDRAWAEQHLPGDQPTLVISPCSSHPLRNWAAERYARVADHAAGSLGMRVVLAGGPGAGEQEMAAAIEADMQHTPLNLVGRDSLTQSMAVLERASVLLSPDSGPVHIASALGTPVIGLYAATWSRRSGPYNSPDLVVDRFAEAARKYRHREPEELRWGTRIEEPGVMDLIAVDDVIAQLERARG